jgi:hypothetical protein
VLQGDDLRSSGSDDDIDFELDELAGNLGGEIAASLCPTRHDRDGAALDPAKLMQPLDESGNPTAVRRRCSAKISDGRQLARLLRCRRQWPRRRAA